MKKYMNTIGIVSATALVLSYPAYLLYKYMVKRGKKSLNDGLEEVEHPIKHLFSSRKKHNLHHRHPEPNGHAGHLPA